MTDQSETLTTDGELTITTETQPYSGTLDLDILLTQVMNAHGPRLAAGLHQAEYWCYRDDEIVCRIGVHCKWTSQSEKITRLAFSVMPIPAVFAQEIVWIADVNLAEVLINGDHSEIRDALLIVSYRPEDRYVIVFPYTQEHGELVYDPPLFEGVAIPNGFVDVALRSTFTHAEHDEATRKRLHRFRRIAAASAATYEHVVEFPQENDDLPLEDPKGEDVAG